MKSIRSIYVCCSAFLTICYIVPINSMETTQSPRVIIPFVSTEESIHDVSHEKLCTFLKALRISQQMRIDTSHNADPITVNNDEKPAGYEDLKQVKVTKRSNL